MNNEWFKKRWNKMGDDSLREVLKVASPQYTDPSIYLQELILDEPSDKIADKRLTILENLILQSKSDRLEVEMERVRIERDRMLALSDFSQLSDVPLTNEEKKSYRQYRKYLRELPKLIERDQVLDFSVKTFKEWTSSPVIYEDWNKA